MALVYYALWLCVWLALTGMISLTGIITGLLLAILPDLFANRDRQHNTREAIRALPRLVAGTFSIIAAVAVMVKNILVGAYGVVKILMSREIELEPCLVHFTLPASALTSGSRSGSAQSVQGEGEDRISRVNLAVLTLSPGVIPVDGPDENGEITVHALTREGARALVKANNDQ